MISNALARLCMGIVLVITVALLSKLQLTSEQMVCFVSGILTAGILAFIWSRFSAWARNGARPGQTQTITFHTDETPAQISWAAVRSFFLLLLLLIGLLVAAALALGVAFNVDLVNSLRSLLKP